MGQLISFHPPCTLKKCKLPRERQQRFAFFSGVFKVLSNK